MGGKYCSRKEWKCENNGTKTDRYFLAKRGTINTGYRRSSRSRTPSRATMPVAFVHIDYRPTHVSPTRRRTNDMNLWVVRPRRRVREKPPNGSIPRPIPIHESHRQLQLFQHFFYFLSFIFPFLHSGWILIYQGTSMTAVSCWLGWRDRTEGTDQTRSHVVYPYTTRRAHVPSSTRIFMHSHLPEHCVPKYQRPLLSHTSRMHARPAWANNTASKVVTKIYLVRRLLPQEN